MYIFKRTVTPEMLDNEDSMDAPSIVVSVESASQAPIMKTKFDRKKLVTVLT